MKADVAVPLRVREIFTAESPVIRMTLRPGPPTMLPAPDFCEGLPWSFERTYRLDEAAYRDWLQTL